MRKVSRSLKAVALSAVLCSTLVGCGKDSCSGSDRSRKVECGGTMKNGSFWGTAYDVNDDVFWGAVWCGGKPDPSNPSQPDQKCRSIRGAAKRGNEVVCLGYPSPGSTDIPQVVIGCD